MTMRNPPHPGELIRDLMAQAPDSARAALRGGAMPPEAFDAVLDGDAPVTPELALALERIGWSDAEHWLRMQASYDLARLRRAANTERQADTPLYTSHQVVIRQRRAVSESHGGAA